MFHSLRSSCFLAALCFLVCNQGIGQNAMVTFYSPPDPTSHEVKEAFAVHGPTPFRGSIFDGTRRLAPLTPSKYVTFELAAGPNVFYAVPGRRHPSEKYTLPLDLSAGQHSFIRLLMKWKSTGFVLFLDPQFEPVDCRIASQETATSQALEIGKIPKDAHSLISTSSAALPCP
jgi:hypothetical protein